MSEPRRFCQVDAEAIPPALIAARHLGRGMSKLLLDVAFIDFGGRGKAGTQGMPCEFEGAFDFTQIAANAG